MRVVRGVDQRMGDANGAERGRYSSWSSPRPDSKIGEADTLTPSVSKDRRRRVAVGTGPGADGAGMRARPSFRDYHAGEDMPRVPGHLQVPTGQTRRPWKARSRSLAPTPAVLHEERLRSLFLRYGERGRREVRARLPIPSEHNPVPAEIIGQAFGITERKGNPAGHHARGTDESEDADITGHFQSHGFHRNVGDAREFHENIAGIFIPTPKQPPAYELTLRDHV